MYILILISYNFYSICFNNYWSERTSKVRRISFSRRPVNSLYNFIIRSETKTKTGEFHRCLESRRRIPFAKLHPRHQTPPTVNHVLELGQQPGAGLVGLAEPDASVFEHVVRHRGVQVQVGQHIGEVGVGAGGLVVEAFAVEPLAVGRRRELWHRSRGTRPCTPMSDRCWQQQQSSRRYYYDPLTTVELFVMKFFLSFRGFAFLPAEMSSSACTGRERTQSHTNARAAGRPDYIDTVVFIVDFVIGSTVVARVIYVLTWPPSDGVVRARANAVNVARPRPYPCSDDNDDDDESGCSRTVLAASGCRTPEKLRCPDVSTARLSRDRSRTSTGAELVIFFFCSAETSFSAPRTRVRTLGHWTSVVSLAVRRQMTLGGAAVTDNTYRFRRRL